MSDAGYVSTPESRIVSLVQDDVERSLGSVGKISDLSRQIRCYDKCSPPKQISRTEARRRILSEQSEVEHVMSEP